LPPTPGSCPPAISSTLGLLHRKILSVPPTLLPSCACPTLKPPIVRRYVWSGRDRQRAPGPNLNRNTSRQGEKLRRRRPSPPQQISTPMIRTLSPRRRNRHRHRTNSTAVANRVRVLARTERTICIVLWAWAANLSLWRARLCATACMPPKDFGIGRGEGHICVKNRRSS
jgi:hypothetical protein